MSNGQELQNDIDRVAGIAAAPIILDVVSRTTGMRFACIARVTPERWIACSVLDRIDFGLKPGGELKLETTICNQIRQSNQLVVIEDVQQDSNWRTHPTPAMYGFRSYISVPVNLSDGSFFGTLCAIDPLPVRLNTPETIGMFQLFADLIGRHLDASRQLAETQSALDEERSVARIREEFMAVLGHDLRSPSIAISRLSHLLSEMQIPGDARHIANLIRKSATRMQALIDDLLDLTRTRLGIGLDLVCNADRPLGPVLESVIAESQAAHPSRRISVSIELHEPVDCDRGRIAQLLANLLNNALIYGSADKPVRVRAFNDHTVFELSVANAGDPIPSVALKNLFKPFYRHATRKDRDGLGLGLYIAHQIAEAHGGELHVSSSPAETRFTLRMPTTPRPVIQLERVPSELPSRSEHASSRSPRSV
jgi:signal transduction histidine kinase